MPIMWLQVDCGGNPDPVAKEHDVVMRVGHGASTALFISNKNLGKYHLSGSRGLVVGGYAVHRFKLSEIVKMEKMPDGSLWRQQYVAPTSPVLQGGLTTDYTASIRPVRMITNSSGGISFAFADEPKKPEINPYFAEPIGLP